MTRRAGTLVIGKQEAHYHHHHHHDDDDDYDDDDDDDRHNQHCYYDQERAGRRCSGRTRSWNVKPRSAAKIFCSNLIIVVIVVMIMRMPS